MSASNWIHLDVDEIIRATDKAILCRIGSEEVWLPLSQIDDADQYEAGDLDVTISVTEFIAREKGLT